MSASICEATRRREVRQELFHDPMSVRDRVHLLQATIRNTSALEAQKCANSRSPAPLPPRREAKRFVPFDK